MTVLIDGLNPALPTDVLVHDKPLSAASISMQAWFFEAAGWRMLQVMPWRVQALVQSPSNALRNQRWLPYPQAGGVGGGGEGDGGGGEGDGGGGVGEGGGGEGDGGGGDGEGGGGLGGVDGGGEGGVEGGIIPMNTFMAPISSCKAAISSEQPQVGDGELNPDAAGVTAVALTPCSTQKATSNWNGRVPLTLKSE